MAKEYSCVIDSSEFLTIDEQIGKIGLDFTAYGEHGMVTLILSKEDVIKIHEQLKNILEGEV